MELEASPHFFRRGEPVQFPSTLSPGEIRYARIYDRIDPTMCSVVTDDFIYFPFVFSKVLSYVEGFVPSTSPIPFFRLGEPVWAEWEGTKYSGRISKCFDNFSYEVQFGHPGFEDDRDIFDEAKLVPYNLPNYFCHEGDELYCRRGGSLEAFPAVVIDRSGSASLSVLFQDGIFEAYINYTHSFVVQNRPGKASPSSRPLLIRNDKVEFIGRDEPLMGVISYANSLWNVAVILDTGEFLEAVHTESLRLVSRPIIDITRKGRELKKFQKGDLVRAKWRGGVFYFGTITKVNEDGVTYGIDFLEKPKEDRVPYFDITLSQRQSNPIASATPLTPNPKPETESMRFYPGQLVRAKWHDGTMKPAKVVSENFDGTYAIRFDEITYEPSVSPNDISKHFPEERTSSNKGGSLARTASLGPTSSPRASSKPTVPTTTPRGASGKTYRVFEKGTKVLSINNWRFFKDGVKFGEVPLLSLLFLSFGLILYLRFKPSKVVRIAWST